MAEGGSVRLRVTHSVLPMTNLERPFALDMPACKLVQRLQTFVGTEPAHMLVQLRDAAGGVVAQLWDGAEEANSNDNHQYATLAGAGAAAGMTLHVEDRDPAQAVAATQDQSAATKYEMSAEAYAARDGTYRAWKARQAAAAPPSPYAAQPPLAPGARVDVFRSAAHEERMGRATVRFVGAVRQFRGHWLGLEFDEAGLAKGDGSSKGVRYFSCPAGHGIFVRPDRVAEVQEEEVVEAACAEAEAAAAAVEAAGAQAAADEEEEL